MSDPMNERRPFGAPLLWLCGLTVVLAAWTWWRVEGTIFADVVEYLERALAFVRGEAVLDAQQIRAAGVTLLHAPVLLVAEVLGIDDMRWVLPYSALVHTALSCLFVVLVARLGRAMGASAGLEPERARDAGLLAGLVAATSPTFVQFSAIAMTDIASGAALAFAIERALFARDDERDVRVGLAAGLGFGLALVCAFKTIPLIAVGGLGAAATVLFSKGFKPALVRSGAAVGVLGAFAVLQCVFDRITYGEIGSGLLTYVLANFGPTAGALLYDIGLIGLGKKLYDLSLGPLEAAKDAGASRAPSDQYSWEPYEYYFQHFEWFSPRWLIPLFGVGVLVALVWTVRSRADSPTVRRRIADLGRVVTPLAILTLYALVTSRKGAKEMRIWLPILPLFASIAGIGIAAFAGRADAVFARGRTALCGAALVAALVHAPWRVAQFVPNQMAPLARAAEWIEELPRPEGRRPKVAASFHWSALFRTPPSWDLVKLPRQLDTLERRTPEERAEVYATLRELDACIVHAALLSRPAPPDDDASAWARELFDVLAAEFDVAAAFWDRASDPGFGPILVLTNRSKGGATGRVLARTTEAPDGSSGRALVTLTRTLGDRVERIELAGASVARLPGDGILWFQHEVDVRGDGVVADYAVAIGASDVHGSGGFTSFRGPLWNKGRTSALPAGTRWLEGAPLAPAQGPFGGPGGALAETADPTIWWDLVTVDGDGQGGLRVTGRLDPSAPVARRSPAHGLLELGSVPATSEPNAHEDRLRLVAPLGGQ